MQARQSTMFKLLKTFVIISLALSGAANGQSDSGGSTDLSDNSSTGMATTDSDDDSKKGLLGGILDGLQEGPLGFIFRPLGLILRPIFSIADRIISPALGLAKIALSPLGFILRPIMGILGGVGGIAQGFLSNIGRLVSYLISNGSGIVSALLYRVSSATVVNQRKRRAIMDFAMTGMMWDTLSFPLRIVNAIINTILSPFYFIYNLALWPYHLLYGIDEDGLSSALSTDFSISNLVSSFLLNLSDSSQGLLNDAFLASWAYLKRYLLPALDNIFVSASTSSIVPDDIKAWLKSIHSAYSILRMFGIV